MYGRRYQRKRGFHRTLVLLLTLVMLASVCFPGLRASAEDGSMENPSDPTTVGDESVPATTEETVPETTVETIPETTVETIPETTEAYVPVTGGTQDEPNDQANESDSFFSTVMSVLGIDFGVSPLANETIEIAQGESYTYTVGSHVSNLSVSPSNRGVTAKNSNQDITVTAGSDAVIGTYTVGYTINGSEYSFNVLVNEKNNVINLTATDIENADVVYIFFDANTEPTGVSFTSMESGETYNLVFTGSDAHYVLCFVKPSDNHLLTGIGASGSNYIYNIQTCITENNYQTHTNYPNIATYAQMALDAGYIGMFGWTRSTTDNVEFEVHCKSPDIEVKAVSDKTDNVKPGDELTFTVTITPGTTGSGKDTVTAVEIDSITVNGVEVEYDNLIKNEDGTYSTKVKYTATLDDCNNGEVTLKVAASVSYSGTLSVTQGELGSTATIKKEASATCQIADKNSVTYQLYYIYPEETIAKLPDEILVRPADKTEYYEGESVSVNKEYGKDPVTDATNGGTWTFDGWYLDDEKVESAVMTKDGLVFKGKWIFKKTLCTVTVKKNVTGNMGDYEKEFSFTAYVNDEEFDTFSLKNGESCTLINVPLGAELVIKETNADGYTVSVGDDTIKDAASKEDAVYTVTPVTEGLDITFTNNKTATIDTGVFTDTAPYIILFSVAAVGAAVLLTKKRRYQV